MKGILHKKINGSWVVIQLSKETPQCDTITEYGIEYPLNPTFEKYYFLDEDAEGEEVEFDMVNEYIDNHTNQVQKYAKLKRPIPELKYKDGTSIRSYHSPKIQELLDEINLEEVSKEQLEQERNPTYKYFDPLQQVADEIDANIVKMMIKASRETMINYTKWLAQEEWMSIWVEDKWMWECQKENNKYLDSTNSYGYVTEEVLYDLYLKNL